MIKARFETLPPKRFIGMRLRMSFSALRTYDLWHGFMPRRKEIQQVVGSELYSMEVVPEGFFEPYDPGAGFDKWACVEVTEGATVPAGMEELAWEGGLYAVFLHQGPPSRAAETYGQIFGAWIPASGYSVDNRPHFAVMGDRYRGEAEDSEEEIWIPVVENRDA